MNEATKPLEDIIIEMEKESNGTKGIEGEVGLLSYRLEYYKNKLNDVFAVLSDNPNLLNLDKFRKDLEVLQSRVEAHSSKMSNVQLPRRLAAIERMARTLADNYPGGDKFTPARFNAWQELRDKIIVEALEHGKELQEDSVSVDGQVHQLSQ